MIVDARCFELFRFSYPTLFRVDTGFYFYIKQKKHPVSRGSAIRNGLLMREVRGEWLLVQVDQKAAVTEITALKLQ